MKKLRMHMSISADLYEELDYIADINGLGVPELIEKILTDFIKKLNEGDKNNDCRTDAADAAAGH